MSRHRQLDEQAVRQHHHRKVLLLLLLIVSLVLSLFRPQALAVPQAGNSEMFAIHDIIAKRTDPISQNGFDEIDVLILTTASYLELGQGDEERLSTPISLGTAIDENGGTSSMGSSWLWDFHGKQFVTDLTASSRYSEIPVTSQVSILEDSPACQFCATTFDIPAGPLLVAFRGTDNSVTAWEEDALASVDGCYPAQEDARKYLEEIAGTYPDRDIWVCGHSKGGNMAEYAAATADDGTFSRISQVRSYDGFGFGDALPGRAGTAEYNEKLVKYSPEQSVFGRLFESRTDITSRIIESDGDHFCQHATTNWLVADNELVHADAYGKLSDAIADSADEWVSSYSPEQRQQLVNSFFSVVRRSGLLQWTDFAADPKAATSALVSEVSDMPSTERKTVMDAIGHLATILAYHGVIALSPMPSFE